MAFGDALRSTDGATVVLNVDTSQTAKLEQAEAQWRESVGQMSREAIKLDLAQDRLKKSLQQYGAESAQAKRATIALKDAEEQATRAASRQERQTKELTAAQSRQRSGTTGLTRGVVGLASAYVGIHGLITVVRSSLEAAKEEQNVMGQTRIALEALGISYEQHIGRIDSVIRAQSRLGFDDEELIKTFQTFVTSTKDVNEALELNALAADVARGRYLPLEQAAQLVNKANLGMSGALRRVGIDVDKGAGRIELLTLLTERYGQAAEGASDDAVAASDRLSVEWENMQEILGQGLLPFVTDLSDRLADYFGDAENQREVQKKLNSALETGEDVVKGIAGGFQTIHRVLKPVIDLLGGTEKAVRDLIIVMAVAKVVAFAGSLRMVGNNARFATGQVAALAAASALPMGGGPRGAGRGWGPPGVGIGPVGLGLTTLAVAGYFGIKSSRTAAIDANEMQKLMAAARSGKISPSQLQELRGALTDSQYKTLAAAISGDTGASSFVSPDTMDTRRPGRMTPRAPREEGGGGGRRPGGRTLADITLDIAREQAGGGTGERFLQEERSMYARKIAALEARKNLTAKQKAALEQLYGELASVDSQLEAIESDEEQKLEDRRAAAGAKRERLAEKRKVAREKEARREARETAEEVKRAGQVGKRIGRWGMGRSTAEVQRLHTKHVLEQRDETRELQRQVRSSQFEFLSMLKGTMNQAGSNLFAPGQLQVAGAPNPELFSMVTLMREQNHMIAGLGASVRQPGTRYAGTEIAHLFDGPTF